MLNEMRIVPPGMRLAVFERDGYKCKICGRDVSDGVKLEVDHIVPFIKGGHTWPNNLCVLCFDCNRGKGSGMPSEELFRRLSPELYIGTVQKDGSFDINFFVTEDDFDKMQHYAEILKIDWTDLYAYIVKYYIRSLFGKRLEVIDMANSPSKRFASCEIDPDEHSVLHSLATHWGQPVTNVVAMAVRDFLKRIDPTDPSKMTPELVVYQNSIKAKRLDYMREWLKDLAYSYMAHPTEELSDLLRDSAEVAGIPVEEILEGIEQDKLTPVTNTPGNRALEKAIDFLNHAMIPGQEYPSIQIKDAAKEQGIAEYNINEAKRALNIRSERRATNWVWIKE